MLSLILGIFFFADKAYEVLSGIIKGKKFNRYTVFELPVKGENKEEQYIKFLLNLIKKTPKKQRSALYETLLYYACENKDKKKLNQLLKEYRELESALKENSPLYGFPRYFELRRRAEYFENKNCGEDTKRKIL